MVSAYPTINVAADSMTVVLVKRSLTEAILVNLNFSEFHVNIGKSPIYSISNLGVTETFISHSNNALKKTQVEASASKITVELAPLSVNSISLTALVMGSAYEMQKNSFNVSVYPNPATDQVNLSFSLPEKRKLTTLIQ
ncbi:MAG: hypothetical protein Q8K69_12505 [Bacteroidota bacterium]|nr:hypothetical protein [Bacteroidota bacterium]